MIWLPRCFHFSSQSYTELLNSTQHVYVQLEGGQTEKINSFLTKVNYPNILSCLTSENLSPRQLKQDWSNLVMSLTLMFCVFWIKNS